MPYELIRWVEHIIVAKMDDGQFISFEISENIQIYYRITRSNFVTNALNPQKTH